MTVSKALSSSPAGTSPFFDGPRHIVMISPQPWDGLQVSKHHYAAELAALGHRVTFVDPPDARGRPGAISIRPADMARIERLSYTPLLPYELKFHARPLFDWGMGILAKRIVARFGEKPDVVWDFDNSYQFADLRPFGAPLRIFHPVDSPAEGRSDAKNANLVLSVSQTFIDRLAPVQGHVIPHALSPLHLAHAREVVRCPRRKPRESRRLRVGYVGNLEHVGIDWTTILRLARGNPDVLFRFIGPFAVHSSRAPLSELRTCANIELTGKQSPEQVLATSGDVDIWLVCYDATKTIDGAINSHKVLEYLATGHPVVCNRIAAYANSDIIQMPSDSSSAAMLSLLKATIDQLPAIDGPNQRSRRAGFAAGFSYEGNLRQIDELARSAFVSSGPATVA